MSRIAVSEPRQARTPTLPGLLPYLVTLLVCWAALTVFAYNFAHQERAPWIVSAALPAFLIESVFYLGALFAGFRAWFAERFWSWTQGGILWASALAPYLVFSFLAGTFYSRTFLLLAGLTGVLSFWFVFAPRRATYDVGFLVLAAAPVLLRVFPRIYAAPTLHAPIRIDYLGHLMVVHVAVLALLVLRQWNPGPVGPWPNRAEWRAGVVYYLLAVAPLCGLALSLHAVKFAPRTGHWWMLAALAAGYFAAMFWVTVFSEELLFRGVIERALLDSWRSRWAAIVVSSLLFGAVHLWVRHFPNWNWMSIATVLGLFLGWAYVRTGSIRATMVTHTLVIVTWRMLFS
ncbi:MAG TPA: CPBP family intramembrane glutamic endopeptidase [Bryobacteraceae bacterium]|nr:CPBP family intramembrane glutamic endopeptidase [Bryobacteraceae bacterium]